MLLNIKISLWDKLPLKYCVPITKLELPLNSKKMCVILFMNDIYSVVFVFEIRIAFKLWNSWVAMSLTIRDAKKRLYHCDPQFKYALTYWHQRCSKTKLPSWYSGRKINQYLGKLLLNHDAKYKVCNFKVTKIKGYKEDK